MERFHRTLWNLLRAKIADREKDWEKFQDSDQHPEPFGLEEDIDQVWEDTRVAEEVRIRRQFKLYSERQENLQVGDYVYAAVLPPITNSRKNGRIWK